MAGGEPRLGTDSMYMAHDIHRYPRHTTTKSSFTLLHFGGQIAAFHVELMPCGFRQIKVKARPAPHREYLCRSLILWRQASSPGGCGSRSTERQTVQGAQ